jgi:hypothetical protein
MSKTPKSDAALEQWGSFTDEIRQRLESGKRAYGDSSFERPEERLITEIQQELLDVTGWSFILWHRLEALRSRVEQCAADHSSSLSSAESLTTSVTGS